VTVNFEPLLFIVADGAVSEVLVPVTDTMLKVAAPVVTPFSSASPIELAPEMLADALPVADCPIAIVVGLTLAVTVISKLPLLSAFAGASSRKNAVKNVANPRIYLIALARIIDVILLENISFSSFLQ
jgi:hypothetical protein